MRECQMGCICRKCIFDAYADWMATTEDMEVVELVAEILNEDHEPQDVVEFDYLTDYPQ